MKYIGIMGGSFDPPHLSHKAIADECIRRKLVDQVWILPAYHHVEKKNIATFEQRIKMCKIMFGGLFSKIKVKNFEKWNREGTTFNLLKILQKQFPHYRFTIIIGEDCADHIDTWFRYEELIKSYFFIVFKREDYFNFKPKDWYKEKPHKFIKVNKCFYSSSLIRKYFLKKHYNLIKLMISKKVFKYIIKEQIDYENHKN